MCDSDIRLSFLREYPREPSSTPTQHELPATQAIPAALHRRPLPGWHDPIGVGGCQGVRSLRRRVPAATLAQVQQLVDGLDAETCLAWANEIAPDAVPSFEAWAQPERTE